MLNASTSEGAVHRVVWYCGKKHDFQRRESCAAYGKTCSKCRKPNHFAAKCRSTNTPAVQPVVEDQEPEEHDEVFPVAGGNLDDSQLVTLRLESGCHIRFQVDTGAQCNVVPLGIYNKATKDTQLKQVTPTLMHITAYGATPLPVLGTVILRVWRGDFSCRLDCKLVDGHDIRPLLGRKACIGMKIVSYLDNDQMNKPETRGAPVYALEAALPQPVKQLTEMYPEVFSGGVGRLEGQYHIRIDESVPPVQHAPRHVAVPLREVLQRTLTELTQQEIIAPVQEPTTWISSMVVVPKKNGTLRICLDPQDLNRAIQREHYPLPTIEDIATRLHGENLFTVLDVT